jgi:argininosuccinate lyase
LAKFPAPVYAETVLAHNFADAQRLFLDALLEMHYAHALMLDRQGIMPRAATRLCIAALDSLDREALRTIPYDDRFEDLFFYIEAQLENIAGPENAGRMHTARSRNDIDLTIYRMRLREDALAIVKEVASVHKTLLTLAHQHIDTLMPAYTHTQPAQPTTLAHYLLAAVECFGRDQTRLIAAFATINRNPLGACAITTTGFPIDRHYTAELLGFEGLQLNSYGAIAATDYVTELAGVVATVMANLGKLTQDLLLWCNPELNFLRLPDAWVQISSIMPQKRNPVALEHTRIIASRTLAQAQGVFTAVHNTPFGDIVDSEDDLQPLVFNMTADALRALRLFAGIMSDCEVNQERLEERAGADFLTVTELADTLVRSEGLSFREAHHLVSDAVRALEGHYTPAAMVGRILDQAPALRTSREMLLHALDPRAFVDIRRIPGGPAREPVEAALSEADAFAATTCDWIARKTDLLASYPKRIRQACVAL